MKREGSRLGITMVELLVAMAVLFVILAITAAAIVQSISVNRVAQEVVNSQAKLRRITEVITQELRAAVLGGISDVPVPSGRNSVSFALLTGDGGVIVGPNVGTWGVGHSTDVFSMSASQVENLLNHPAVVINSARQAALIPQITHVNASGTTISHANCRIPIPYDPGTRVFSAVPVGFDFDSETGVLSMLTFDAGVTTLLPFAFALTRFEIAYEYVSSDGIVQSREIPWLDSLGQPQPSFSFDGDEYTLKRLMVVLEDDSDSGAVNREYVAYVELSGIGNDRRPVTSLAMCRN